MHAHQDYVADCFTCKLRTLQFATVPGGYRQTSGGSYYDRESLKDQGISVSKEEVMDKRADFARMYKDLDRETGLA